MVALSMRTPYILIPLFLTLKAHCTSANMDSKALSSSVAKFSAKFCNELDKEKSFVSSPLSAQFALAFLTLGTSEPAHSELLASLGIPDDDSIRSSFSSLSSKLKSIQGVTLDVANKVYLNEGDYDINAELKKDAVEVFDSDFEKLDCSDGGAAANTVNKWVESKTNNRIKDLLSSDSFNSDTRLVIVNALYFKGKWENQFLPHATSDQSFFVNKDKEIMVPMMRKEDKFNFAFSEELGAQLLELKYEGNEASMLIVLPNEIEGLEDVMKKLADGVDLMDEVEKMQSMKVNVALPKFKIETEIDLGELLPKVGIKSIFEPDNGCLNNLLTSKESLFVSKAVQKAFIEVNEEGAEAAAATAMMFVGYSAILEVDPVQEFTADRPFLAAVLVQGAPYFLATYRGDGN